MKDSPKRHGVLLVAVLAAGAIACGGGERSGASGLSGFVRIDGSSTVFPVTEAVAEEFQIANPDARVTVGISGTGGGFKKFCNGETDISDASRPIKDSELELCRDAGIEPIEIRVAFDGLAVMVNPGNDFAACMTVDELKRIWEPGSTVSRWSQVRDGWPDEEIELYGPGTDSGTFDYFTEAIVGEEDASRPDFTASEDDNVLVQGIAGDPYSLGYFGYAYCQPTGPGEAPGASLRSLLSRAGSPARPAGRLCSPARSAVSGQPGGDRLKRPGRPSPDPRVEDRKSDAEAEGFPLRHPTRRRVSQSWALTTQHPPRPLTRAGTTLISFP
jgi:phosphate binding protein